ncbi:sensor histidine kinase [Streptomyces halobius]|uniref:histidine kinase n=1 Tax=Streptomyces halobius TaxID=2879846 RepID=A0ABY4M9H7_9ACTN|nr:sensor histidine kinase [Streptomyces halobius]UQA94007.1 sensor histidine kinase [Streptomyces halobius]
MSESVVEFCAERAAGPVRRDAGRPPTAFRVAAGLIYLSVGSLVGLLLVPLVVGSVALRAVTLLLSAVPQLATLGVRSATAAVRRALDAERPPRRAERFTARAVWKKAGDLRAWFVPSLPLLRAVADLERLLAASVVDPGSPPRRPRAKGTDNEADGKGNGPAGEDAGWADFFGYLGLLLLGTVWLVPILALVVPIAAFAVSLPIGPPEQLAFGPGLTVLVEGFWTRLAVGVGSMAGFGLLVTLLFWLGKVRARLVRRVLSRVDAADERRKKELAELRRTAALRVNDADYRRLERDLHDGAQARLAVLLMRLSHAKRRVGKDPEAFSRLLDETYQEVSKALDELRDLVRGVQPPILSDRGLDAAVAVLTEKFHVPVVVRSTLSVRPAASLESAAYYIIAESLTNAVKHASATELRVDLDRADGCLRVAVTDNGSGGASQEAGTGLRGLADRATALNGELTVTSPPGGPTTVRAVLPWA